MKPRIVLTLIWLAFVVRGCFYAAALPIWEGLDEWAHFAYVDHLASFGALPGPETRVSEEVSRSLQLAPIAWSLVLMPPPSVMYDVFWNLPEAERARRESEFHALPVESRMRPGREVIYEGKQPPLYYALGVPVLKLAAGTSLATRALALRLFTVLLASLVVPLTFSIARVVLGGTTPAILAATLTAAMPVLSMTAARVANDALAIVLFAILARLLVRKNPWDGPGALGIGLALGAGLLTKAYFIGCAPALIVSAVAAVWNSPPNKRGRIAGFMVLAATIGFAISGWWYIRILAAPGPVWADIVPSNGVGLSRLWSSAVGMPWWDAAKGSLDIHFWFAGWSFLAVRSWIYLVLRWVFIALLLSSSLSAFKNRSGLRIVWGMYAGFWVAMTYHMFVTFMSQGIPSSTGHYLYAVIACESVILCSGARRKWVIASLVGAFLLVEAYATHFVAVPYYTGLIRHRADTSLEAFHLSQGVEMGLKEVLLRLGAFKPEFVTAPVLVALWIAFLVVSAGLLVLACRESRFTTETQGHRGNHS